MSTLSLFERALGIRWAQVRVVEEGESVGVVIDLMPGVSARDPSETALVIRLTALVRDPTSALYRPSLATNASTGILTVLLHTPVASPALNSSHAPEVSDSFTVRPTFDGLSVSGGPSSGGTVVGLLGFALDAFNAETPENVRCRWGPAKGGGANEVLV